VLTELSKENLCRRAGVSKLSRVGLAVGLGVLKVGIVDGDADKLVVGVFVVGVADGQADGMREGSFVGIFVGVVVAVLVGVLVTGVAVGFEGTEVGLVVGAVGFLVTGVAVGFEGTEVGLDWSLLPEAVTYCAVVVHEKPPLGGTRN
jgi:hypothetical protein